MLSAAFLPTLILVTGQLFQEPVFVSSSVHLHVAKGGHWTFKEEATFRPRSADQTDAVEEFCNAELEALLEACKSKKAECDGQVTVAGENRYTIVVTCKAEDVVDLLERLQGLLGLERCAFSWDRSCLRIGGFPPKYEPSVIGAILGAIVLAILPAEVVDNVDYKEEFVLTTDGRFVAENLPAKLEDDGRRLVLDLFGENESPEQERILRIEGLEE